MAGIDQIADLRVNQDHARALTLRDVPALRRLSGALRSRILRADELGAVAGAFPDHAGAPRASGHRHCGAVTHRPLAQALRHLGLLDLAEATEAQQDPPGWPDKWERYETRRVVVAYTLDSAAVPEHVLRNGHEQSTTGDGVPDHVRTIASLAESALEIFGVEALKLRRPAGLDRRNRLTIRLLELEKRRGETDPRWNHIAIDRDLEGDDARLTIGHEIFHRIQYAYNPTTEAGRGLYLAFREGGARLAEECILDSADRYIRDGYLDMPARPLVAPADGAIEPHSYSTGLFWKYVCEQHGELPESQSIPAGFDAYVRALETMHGPGASGDGPYLISGLRRARARMAGAGTFDGFLRLDGPDRRHLVSTETTWGNFLAANCLHGTAVEMSDRRFKYEEESEDPRDWHSVIVSKVVDLPAQNGAPMTLQRGATKPMPPYSASYYKVDLGPEGARRGLLKLTFEANGGMTDPLVQLVLRGPNNTLVDLIRLDGMAWTKTVSCAGVDNVVVIAAARETEGGFTLDIQEVSGRPLVSTTRWNCDAGDSYETDPKLAPWTWTSPDLVAGPLGDQRRIRLRVRNRGDAPALNVTVRFAWQAGGDAPLNVANWRSIGSTEPVELAAGAEDWVSMDWLPPPEAASGFALKAEVVVPDDPDEDGKTVIGAFGRITFPDFADAVVPSASP